MQDNSKANEQQDIQEPTQEQDNTISLDRKQVWERVKQSLSELEHEMVQDHEARVNSFLAHYPEDEAIWGHLTNAFWMINRWSVVCVECGRMESYKETLERLGRGSLLTCGDVECNPGPRTRTNAITKALTTALQGLTTGVSEQQPQPSQPKKETRNARRRRRQRNKRRRARVGQPTALVRELNVGRVTDDTPQNQVALGNLRISESALGWYYKYMDPAGAVEAGKAFGEFSKIPDGQLRFSVDGEQRPIVLEECPLTDTSETDLGNQLWSISFVSVPCFRLNYIAIASTMNEEIDLTVSNALLRTINNIVNWRSIAETEWREFLPNWFYRIRVLPNTYQMADERGYTDGITAFRKTCRGVTFEFNAPTIFDQGWWVGGHFPIRPRPISVPTNGEFTDTAISIETLSLWPATATGNVADVLISIPGLPQTVVANPTTGVTTTDEGAGSFNKRLVFPSTSTGVGSGFSFITPVNIIIDNEIWAAEGNTVTMLISSQSRPSVTWTLSSSNPSATEIVITTPDLHEIGSVALQLGLATEGYNRMSLEMPPLTTAELTANNPKIQQHLCKDSGGAYLVHYNMQIAMAFEMTGETNFGNFRFHYPGYPELFNLDGDRGIIDTWENNFSTAVVHFRGISKAATIVTKTYDGWEGTTSTSSELGQFAHTGLEEEDEILQLARRLQNELTGVYQEQDNFAALVACLASKALSGIARGLVTNSTIKAAAESAVGAVTANPQIATDALGVVGTIGARLVSAIKQRRARKRGMAR